MEKTLVGKKFGAGVVLEKVSKPNHLIRNGQYWRVQCECGSESIVDTTTLKKKWKKCRCHTNLIGQKFGDSEET